MTDTIETETPDAATAAQETSPDASLYDRLGGLYGIAGAVDVLTDRLYDTSRPTTTRTSPPSTR